jgi:hypothetical protein
MHLKHLVSIFRIRSAFITVYAPVLRRISAIQPAAGRAQCAARIAPFALLKINLGQNIY